MGAKYTYSMYNTDFFTLKCTDNNYEPFVFQDNNGSRDKFRIEELDLITSKYESFDSFYSELLKYNGRYIKGNDKDIVIVHEHNGNLYNDEMIFNDKMVASVASKVKNNVKAKDGLLIPYSTSIYYFIKNIEDIATSSQYRYLLEPDRIQNISVNDMNVLSSCIKKDIKTDDKTVKKGIHSLLVEYREAFQKNNEYIVNGLANEHTKSEVDRIRNQIDKYVRSNYKVFRDLVAWEQRYNKVLNKQFINEKDSDKKIEYFKLILDIGMEKDLREEKIDDGDIYKYYELYRNNITISDEGKIIVKDVNDTKINNCVNRQIEKIGSIGRK